MSVKSTLSMGQKVITIRKHSVTVVHQRQIHRARYDKFFCSSNPFVYSCF